MNCRLLKRMITIAASMAIATSLMSYSLLEAGYEPYSQTDGIGNTVGVTDARSAAMGGAGVSGGMHFLDTAINPASLTFLKTGFGCQFNYGILRNNDRRSIPIYNFFDSYIDEATYSNNSNWYDEAAVGGYYNYQFGRAGVALGLSYTPEINFDADYSEDVRNDEGSDNNAYPVIIARNTLESEGAIRSTSMTLAGNFDNLGPIERLGFGVEIAMYEGEHYRTKKIIWSDEARLIVQNFVLPDYNEKMEREFSGTGFKIGANARFADYYGFGFAYTPKTELEVDYKLDGVEMDVDDYVMPSKIQFGLFYSPQNVMRTCVNIDMEIVNWSEVEDYYEDAINFYLGVEHKIFMTMPVRLGFRYETCPIESIAMPTFTCGTGVQVYGPLWFDFSMEYSRRKYQGKDLFPESYYDDENYAESASYESQLWNYVTPTDREESDKIEETFLKFQGALTLTF